MSCTVVPYSVFVDFNVNLGLLGLLTLSHFLTCYLLHCHPPHSFTLCHPPSPAGAHEEAKEGEMASLLVRGGGHVSWRLAVSSWRSAVGLA